MNKDVVYIEPEDDITDIITKIENAKERVVALVPPKKASVFRSIVNIKLISKAGSSANKTVVLVTTDPSIVKLAAATKLPVTKNLQTAPVIPEVGPEGEIETTSHEEVIDAPATGVVVTDGNVADEDSEEADGAESDKEATSSDEDSEEGSHGGDDSDAASRGENEANSEAQEATEDSEGGAKATESKDAGKGDIGGSRDKGDPKKRFSKAWFLAHKKLVIGVGCGAVALVVLLIWMFAIAPAATIDIGIRTTTANFSENVIFTTVLSDENAEEGKFYLTEAKLETSSSVEFEATGQKNIGEKASGEVKIYAYFTQKGASAITKGDTIRINGLSFVADAGATVSWDGAIASCSNKDAIMEDINVLYKPGCLIYGGSVKVTAAEVGAKYNVAASSSGWETTANVGVYSDTAMTGGTDKYVTVVTQADVDAAKDALKIGNEAANKEKLLASVGDSDNVFVIESSYQQAIGDAVAEPKVGEEVAEGKKAKLTVVVTDSLYTIDRVKVEEFIKAKAKLADNFKIYSMNDPFVENFLIAEGGATGKLKTSYVAGPAVTVADVLNIVRGKGTGTATHELLDIDGIGSVTITTSFPWVTSVPSDENRVTVNIDTGE